MLQKSWNSSPLGPERSLPNGSSPAPFLVAYLGKSSSLNLTVLIHMCTLQGPPLIQHEKEGGHTESLVEENLGGQFQLCRLVCSDARGNGLWIGSNTYLLAPLRLSKEEATEKTSPRKWKVTASGSQRESLLKIEKWETLSAEYIENLWPGAPSNFTIA
ncbi:hypothetical protein E5288_WYG019356 [Bos mutus]|uniref:Uncharacterized protein n=1 Tax=Bos mutus TaxID=72004 RepID=A0A6B0RFT1_9CETA|nr:hypothetical protein [Bos mutus]